MIATPRMHRMALLRVRAGWLLGLMAVPALLDAAVFRVGAGGDYATLQAGLNAANNGGSNEVRVRAGSYTENLTLALGSGTLTVTGGWNAGFTLRDTDPLATTVNGAAAGRVLDATVSNAASLTLRGLQIVGGLSNSKGGGINLTLGNTAFTRLAELRFVFNSVQTHGVASGYGGALAIGAYGDSALILEDSDFLSNAISNSDGALGGGLRLDSDGNANVLVQRCIFDGNSVTPNAGKPGGDAAISAYIHHAAHLSVVDSRFHANQKNTTVSGAQAATLRGDCDSTCQIDLVRSVFDGNLGPGPFQVWLAVAGPPTGGQGIANVDDTVLARGDAGGIYAASLNSQRLHLVNLTVTENPGSGVYLDGDWSLYNSIVWDNGSDVTSVTPGWSEYNLIGSTDPLFADGPNGNYRLTATSPGRNAGTATPMGGLSLYDVLGEARNNESAPDIGAYEFGDRIFRSRFERLQ